MKTILLFLFFTPLLVFSQNNLTIDVVGVPNSEGNIMVALYHDSDSFLKSDRVFRSDKTHAIKGKTSLSMEEIPDGEYAIAVYHDENGNLELDKNWLGIPKETVGFSKARMKTFGPPSFEECAFNTSESRHIRVDL